MTASCLFMRTNLICCCGLKNLIFFIFTFFTNLSIVNFDNTSFTIHCMSFILSRDETVRAFGVRMYGGFLTEKNITVICNKIGIIVFKIYFIANSARTVRLF